MAAFFLVAFLFAGFLLVAFFFAAFLLVAFFFVALRLATFLFAAFFFVAFRFVALRLATFFFVAFFLTTLFFAVDFFRLTDFLFEAFFFAFAITKAPLKDLVGIKTQHHVCLYTSQQHDVQSIIVENLNDRSEIVFLSQQTMIAIKNTKYRTYDSGQDFFG